MENVNVLFETINLSLGAKTYQGNCAYNDMLELPELTLTMTVYAS